jgi:Flp pilus assembly protein TadD
LWVVSAAALWGQRRETPLGFVVTATGGGSIVPMGSHGALHASAGDFLFAGDTLFAETGQVTFFWCGGGGGWLFQLENRPRTKAVTIRAVRPELPDPQGGFDCVLPALERNPEVASVPPRTEVERGAANLTSVASAVQSYRGQNRARLDTFLRGDLTDPRQRLLLATALENAGLLREAAREYVELAKVWTNQPRLLKLAVDLEHPGPAVRSLVLPPPEKPAQQGTGTVHALVIGIRNYEDPRLNLKFPDRDASAFVDYLHTPRGGATDVVPLLNADARISRIRNEFTDMLLRLKPEDTFVFFAASHGDMDPATKTPRIVTYRTRIEEPGINAMPLTEIRKFMLGESAPYRDARIFLDVCHSGDTALLQSPLRTSEGKRKNPKSREIPAPPNFFALTATHQGANAYAYEDELFDRHGVFTYFLLRGLNSHEATTDRILTYGALALYVQNHVATATNIQQYPAFTAETELNHAIADLNQRGLTPDPTPYDRLRLPPEKLVRQIGRRTASGMPAAQGPLPDSSTIDRRVALEDQGEAILLRYLEGEERPQKETAFVECARIYAEAMSLQQGSPYLEARHSFCEGRAQIFDKKYTDAVLNLEKSVRLDPTAAYAYNALGIAYLEQGDIPRAMLAFRDAIDRAPRWAYPRHNLALAYTEDGNFDEAVRTYKAAMEFAPEYFYLPYNLGLLYERMNLPVEAATQYEIARMRAEERAEPVTALAMLRAGSGKRKEAIASLRTAVAMPNQESNATKVVRHDLALLLSVDPATRDEAIALWRQNGAYPSSQLSLAQTLEEAGRLRTANLVYRELLQSHPDHISARLNLAGLLEESGNPLEAVEELTTAIQQLPGNSLVLEELAFASAQAGDISSAKSYYAQSLAKTGDTAAKKRIRAAIHDLERRR